MTSLVLSLLLCLCLRVYAFKILIFLGLPSGVVVKFASSASAAWGLKVWISGADLALLVKPCCGGIPHEIEEDEHRRQLRANLPHTHTYIFIFLLCGLITESTLVKFSSGFGVMFSSRRDSLPLGNFFLRVLVNCCLFPPYGQAFLSRCSFCCYMVGLLDSSLSISETGLFSLPIHSLRFGYFVFWTFSL